MPRHRLDYRQPDSLRARSIWDEYRVLLIVAGALWLAMSLFLAGVGWSSLLYALLTDGMILMLWAASAAGAGAAILRMFASADDSLPNGLLRVVTETALGLGIFSLLTLGLGLLGWLNRVTAFALLGAGLALMIWQLWGRRDRAINLKDVMLERAGWSWLWLVAVPFASILTVAAVVPPGFLWKGEPNAYDVVEYHLQVPREWYEAHRIIPLRHNVFSFFPFNVEMHYLLAMHLRGGPWAGMFLAQFMHAAFVVLTVVAVYAIARQWGPKPGAVLAGVAAATVPWLTQVGSIAYDEGGLLLYGTLAVGWAIVAVTRFDHRRHHLIIAGAMAGFACGVKLMAVPEVLLPVAAVAGVMLLVARERWVTAVANIALFVSVALLCFAPWLVRTWAWTGNPLFPTAQFLGHGYFSDVQVERFERAHAARPDQRSLPARAAAAWEQILSNWQYGFLLLPLGFASFAAAFRQREAIFLLAMLALLALFWLLFTHLQGRFFLLSVPLCALLVGQIRQRLAVPVITLLIGLAATVNFVLLNRQLPPGLGQVVGLDDYAVAIPDAFKSIPKEAPFVLVGDAKAFFYQVPMSRFRYRTIFDADTSGGRGVIKAWAGPPGAAPQWLLIDPNELERFERTYQPFPPLPTEIRSHDQTFLVQRPPGGG